MEENKDFEIDLVDLFFYLKKWIVLILLVSLLFGIIGFVGTKLFGTPKYQTDVTLMVITSTSQTNLTYTDIQISTQLANDVEVLAKSRSVTSKVIQELGLQVSDKALANSIAVSSETNTRVITLTMTGTDPQLLASIANSVAKYTVQTVDSYYGNIDVVKIVDNALVPTTPTGPSASRNAILAAAAAFVLMVAVLCLIRVLDSTIRTEEDVEKYLGLSTLGVIPISNELEGPQKKKRSPLQQLLGAAKPKQAKKK